MEEFQVPAYCLIKLTTTSGGKGVILMRQYAEHYFQEKLKQRDILVEMMNKRDGE